MLIENNSKFARRSLSQPLLMRNATRTIYMAFTSKHKRDNQQEFYLLVSCYGWFVSNSAGDMLPPLVANPRVESEHIFQPVA
jgi:hypothetical protein